MKQSPVSSFFFKCCPFCGGKAEPHRVLDSYWIECEECTIQTGFFSSMVDAVTFWNRRITDVK